MKASIYVAIPVMVALSLLQTAVLPYFSFLRLSPQLPLLVALAWGLLRGLDEGMIWAFIGGICMDLFSITPIGLTALGYMAAVTAVLWLQQAFPPSHIIMPMLLAALATAIYLIINLLSLRLFGFISTLQAVTSLWPLILLNAVAMLPIYWLLYGLDRLLRPRNLEF
ncbi:MAG TPA: rod shape-determining protein MreD [Chloroflexota bacterium]|nr:rod shape-determining protein MreD [Chloroflexota bacterium]HUM70362.1 rod shape-determining protein MreD [Chloroflexota bacterium]